MDWRSSIWTGFCYATNSVVDATVKGLDVVGSLACMVGGAGYATTFALDYTLSGAYYGRAEAAGKIDVNFFIHQYNYNFNETIPFQRSEEMDGGKSYDLQEYINPAAIQAYSASFITAGMVLKALSANLGLWQQGRADRVYAQDKRRIIISMPDSREYLCATARSFFSSLSFGFLSTAVVSTAFNCSGLLGSIHKLTYPAVSMWQVASNHYSGPVDNKLIDITYHDVEKVTIDLPVINLDINVTETINATGTVNATYGGGLTIQSNSSSNNCPVSIPAVAGAASFLACNFFTKRGQALRDNRVLLETQVGYSIAV